MNDESTANTLVTVTGASGFIALHCVRVLLERGFRVRGTVRSPKTAETLRSALLPLEPGERLEFAALDTAAAISAREGTRALAG